MEPSETYISPETIMNDATKRKPALTATALHFLEKGNYDKVGPLPNATRLLSAIRS